jgi:sulfate transport system substrate-binding protein
MVFLVRKGNPHGIKDWDDLAKPGIAVITPNPKTSGGARWNFLASWGYGLKQLGSEQAARDLVTKIYKNAPVLDSGARGSTITFAEREIGDVLITWENEAYLTLKEYGADQFEIVAPSTSILAEPPVTVVDTVTARHGTREVATGYLEYLYSPVGQELAAKHHYRPRDKAVQAKYAGNFATINLFTVDEVFGGWNKAQKQFFADGGVFDQIYGVK